jgi:hypothetical protein
MFPLEKHKLVKFSNLSLKLKEKGRGGEQRATQLANLSASEAEVAAEDCKWKVLSQKLVEGVKLLRGQICERKRDLLITESRTKLSPSKMIDGSQYSIK